MSTLGSDNHLLKIHGIVSLKTGVIFLSDIRLCNSSGTSNINAVTESFRCNPYCAYRFISHSNSNKRGVGILIKHTLSFSVLDEYRDEDDNIIGILIDLEGCIAPVVWSFSSTTAQLYATHRKGSERRKRHFSKCTGLRPCWRSPRWLRVPGHAGRVTLSRRLPPPLIVHSHRPKSVILRKSG